MYFYVYHSVPVKYIKISSYKSATSNPFHTWNRESTLRDVIVHDDERYGDP